MYVNYGIKSAIGSQLIGNTEYLLADKRKIVGDLENSCSFNIIVLATRKPLFLTANYIDKYKKN